jgi:lipopolysaccharide transport system permease protein
LTVGRPPFFNDPGTMPLRQYLEIIVFKAWADLQSERQRTYLGFLWWIFEPIMYMAVMWFVFNDLLKTRTESFALFLLIGLIIWQWFKSCVSHGAVAVLQANSLIQMVPLPPVVFPLVYILTDSFKFVFILAIFLVMLLLLGHAQSIHLLALPAVLFAELALICAVTIWLAAIIPFVPDLRFVTENLLLALMFLSGIFYDLSIIPPGLRDYFYLNPAAFIIREARVVLLDGQWPDFAGLALLSLICLLVAVAGGLLLHRLRGHYPKLPL